MTAECRIPIRRKATEISTLFFALSDNDNVLHPKYFTIWEKEKGGSKGKKITYANDGRIIGHSWRLVLLDVGVVLNS